MDGLGEALQRAPKQTMCDNFLIDCGAFETLEVRRFALKVEHTPVTHFPLSPLRIILYLLTRLPALLPTLSCTLCTTYRRLVSKHGIHSKISSEIVSTLHIHIRALARVSAHALPVFGRRWRMLLGLGGIS
jgi:hypothetical protein